MTGWGLRRGAKVAALVAAAALLGGCSPPAAQGIQSKDQRERLEALQRLAKQDSEEALRAIRDATGHPDTVTARTAVRLVGGMAGAKATGVLEEVAAADPRAEVRRDAVVELGHRKDPGAAGVLRKRLREDADAGVRAAAATALGRLDDRQQLDALVWAALADADLAVQAAAVRGVERTMRLRFEYDPAGPADERRLALDHMRRWAERAGWATPAQPPFASP